MRDWRARLAAWLCPPPPAPSLLARLAGEDALVALLFQDAPAGAVVVDRAGGILRANAALGALLGRAVDLSPGTPVRAIFASAERDAAWDEVAATLAGRAHGPRSLATRLAVAESGDGPSVHLAIMPLPGADGQTEGALLRFADITVQRRLEAQLAQSQKLQAVGQLAGGIAHDFNNLLQAVLASVESISAREALDPELREDAAQIAASAMRGAALVRQLLAFGRQQTLQPRVVSVNEAVTDLSGLLRRLLGEHVKLELVLEEPARFVRVDPTQFDQVLMNLAVNARDAMRDGQGGTLTLRTGHITLYRPLARGPETIPPGRYVMVEVADTGAGIPPEVLPRIFDPFFTTKRESGGTGLGLSTVHGIIRQSEGFLAVESEPGRGTRVRIYLPRWDEAVAIPRPPPPASAPPPPEPPPPAVRPSRVVLLVEDEDPVRRLAERVLARHGWTVLAAASAEAALDLIRGGPPLSAVVTDMVMPGMDGAALVRAIRARPGCARLPAILVSGYAEETLRAGLGATEAVFLAKPYALKDLAAKLDEVASVAVA